MKFIRIFNRRLTNLSCINEKLVCLQQKCVNHGKGDEIILYIYKLINEDKLGFMDSRIDNAIEYCMNGIYKNEIPSNTLSKFVYILSKSMKRHYLKSIYDHFVFSMPFIPYSNAYYLSQSLIKNKFSYDNLIADGLTNYLSEELYTISTPSIVSLAQVIEHMLPKFLNPKSLKIIFDITKRYIQDYNSSTHELLQLLINFIKIGASVDDVLPILSDHLPKLKKFDHHNLILFCDLIVKKAKNEDVFKLLNDSYDIIIHNNDINNHLKIRFFQAYVKCSTLNNERLSNILKWISCENFSNYEVVKYLYTLSKLQRASASCNYKVLANAIVPHINLLIDDMNSTDLSLVSQSMKFLNNSLLDSRINFVFNKLLNDKNSTMPTKDFINVFSYLCKFNGFDNSSLKSTFKIIKIGASGFSIRDISQILMGFSKISALPPFTMFSSIYSTIIANLSKSNSLDISYLLYGLSNLKNAEKISEEYLKMVNYLFINTIKVLKSSSFNLTIYEVTTIIKALSKYKYKSQTLLSQLYGKIYLDGIKLSYYNQSEVCNKSFIDFINTCSYWI